jgi:hypothetical protein
MDLEQNFQKINNCMQLRAKSSFEFIIEKNSSRKSLEDSWFQEILYCKYK